MRHGIGPVLLEDTLEPGLIADIHLLYGIADAAFDLGQGFQVASVGQLVDVNYTVVGVGNDMANHGRADKARAAVYQ